MSLRTVFFGTPELAVPTLEALCAADLAPALVVSQPARPAGRGRRQRQTPVALRAGELGLPVAQPETVRDRELMKRLAELAPDVAGVVAYGQIFRRRLLELPRLGCVNLHASLLPRWRGAAPIQAAIAAGDKVTGVTTMRMTRGLDSGPVLLRAEVPIEARETAAELGARLARRGAELVVETLVGLAGGDLEEIPQDDGVATYAPRLSKADGDVDWRWPARRVFDRLRGFTPWPGLRGELRDRSLKLLWGEPAGRVGAEDEDLPVGTIAGLRAGRLEVVCGPEAAAGCGSAAGVGTVFALERVQRSGRGPVSAVDFFNGERLRAGERFSVAAEEADRSAARSA